MKKILSCFWNPTTQIKQFSTTSSESKQPIFRTQILAMVDTSSNLFKLRQQMKDRGISLYIIPSEDAHQSEYIAPCDGRRAFISGFTGSAGFAMVSTSSATLWTDGRYYLQASKQLDSNWTLMKSGMKGVPTREAWIKQNVPKSSKIGIDPKLISLAAAQTLISSLEDYKVVPIHENLIDLIWTTKPPMPTNKVLFLGDKYSGRSSADKITSLRSQFEGNGVWGFVVSALDEIAWLFNLRGSDIPYNPVFFSYALVTKSDIFLYVDATKLTDEARDKLKGVTILPYDQIFNDLKTSYSSMGQLKLWVDARCNYALQQSLGGAKATKLIVRSPVMIDKGIKNSVELDGFRACHIRDAAALCNFFAWLENELVVNKNTSINEVDAADKLESFRAQQADYVGLSFDTISSVGPNAAIIHYKPERETCAIIKTDQLYLCDSGGQYKDGTTDVTRTLHFGTPSGHEIEMFTRVLKGHIGLDAVIFPQGTTGYMLDVLARTALWKVGLDYRHGTGHGVGHFLNVHEGPHGISFRIANNEVALEAGMTITDEPGYYQDGDFGIRIENVLITVKANTPHNFGGLDYLGFEHVTVCPISTKLVDKTLLCPDELTWLNSYNRECYEKVAPLLQQGGLGIRWLERECQPL